MNEISRFTPFPPQPDLTVREMPLYVFGHKNPDSDSICSALVVADWLNHLGKPAAAGVQAPPLLKGDLRDRKVWLIDFTDVEQGPASLPDSDVVGVIDHHRLGTLITRNPPDVWVRAVGCCATVILQILAAERPMPLSSAQATLLLGAILSDTVALSAPTTTELDRLAVSRLRAISHVDYDAFTAGLLAAKTDLSGLSAAQLLQRDAKNYRIHSVSLLLSQIEVRAMSDIDPLLPALQQALEHAKQEAGLAMAALLVTDITCRRSTLYFSPNRVLDIRQVSLPGMTSRKKEVLPWLTRQIANAGR
ncbi:DHHA2 domain-containing protein [Serratia marcescens]|uniref:DHHA2 domain-containing protein n=1 Tax=Serratia marcescens TaxID=615 RepID=UPI003FA76875